MFPPQPRRNATDRLATIASEVLLVVGAVLTIGATASPHHTFDGIGVLPVACIAGGLGIAIRAGIGSIRADHDGDPPGRLLDRMVAVAGVAIALGAALIARNIADGVLLVVAGVVAVVVAGGFAAGRWLRR
jgi:hypothetical protein